MALWKDSSLTPNSTPAAPDPAARAPTPPASPSAPPPATPSPNTTSAAPIKERPAMKESVISAGLSIEGKIVGSGHVRVAGKFKGDVQVDGNLHIDAGARLEGQVRASEVIVSGELQGNIENAKRVEVQQGGVITGDVKAGQLTVAAGARMRGAVEFGWEEGSGAKVADLKPAATPIK
jgi:cytoskeletal protein CcmA (bactofilin family)